MSGAEDSRANGADPTRTVALVTGASAGIGEEFAEQLAKKGHDLIVVARSADRLETLAARLRTANRIAVDVLPADLTKPEDLRSVERRIEGLPRLDLLVNNAGFGTMGRFATLDADQEEAEIRLNVVALVRLTRAALPAMLRHDRGAVINVSSLAGFQAGPFNATYAATKAYVTSFTESLGEELRGTRLRVQALCPGFTRTEFQDRAGIDVSDLPDLAWMSAASVVESSLAALDRGELVHVPGVTNRLVAGLVRVTPRTVLRRIVGSTMRTRVG
ncbi:MAG: SDR family oxidoreductase [Deltaproteobacteria bacterium]|nr:SDR family oxidoreductase [Deltaproteobacteria bacterium]